MTLEKTNIKFMRMDIYIDDSFNPADLPIILSTKEFIEFYKDKLPEIMK